ncbi:MAG: molybdenum cofactor guanylyltransferase [Planctomycetota bacterium]
MAVFRDILKQAAWRVGKGISENWIDRHNSTFAPSSRLPIPIKKGHPLNHSQRVTLGAVVLCGGKSRRMGTEKSELLIGDRSFMETIVSTLSNVSQSIVLAGSIDLSRHSLPEFCIQCNDENLDCGPLEGVRIGLKTLEPFCTHAFVTCCDAPFIESQLIQHLFAIRNGYSAVIPVDDRRIFGLTAIYRTDCHTFLEKQIRSGRLKVSDVVVELENAMTLSTLSLVHNGFSLRSFENINTQQDYDNIHRP